MSANLLSSGNACRPSHRDCVDLPYRRRGRAEPARTGREFLKRAEECVLISRLATSESAKAAYSRMAELYRQLAEEEAKLKGSGLPLA
jgi:hypothetical protein